VSDKTMSINLKIWRQAGPDKPGGLKDYHMEDLSPNMSFLEMLDLLNEKLIKQGETAIEFDSDCREGICGTCGLNIQGVAHGPKGAVTTCEIRMRHFSDGGTVTVEPFRATPTRVIKDLVVDRSALERIMQAGGFVTSNVGSAPDANSVPISKTMADKAMDAATCIGCGACIAACPNASAMLFLSAKVSQLSYLPQGDPERGRRAMAMITQMDKEGFGACSNHGECEAVCPKEVSIENIARVRREYFKAVLTGE
jgi:succinate dehydrogenase / fumarate reductase, iron-sulfur subunit